LVAKKKVTDIMNEFVSAVVQKFNNHDIVSEKSKQLLNNMSDYPTQFEQIWEIINHISTEIFNTITNLMESGDSDGEFSIVITRGVKSKLSSRSTIGQNHITALVYVDNFHQKKLHCTKIYI
jgi:predicted transcriptional regulator